MTTRALWNFGKNEFSISAQGLNLACGDSDFSNFSKKMGENGECAIFIVFYGILKKNLCAVCEWTWDIADFFMKRINCPL